MNNLSDIDLVGAGIIISRLGTNGSYQRSESYFAANFALLTDFFGRAVSTAAKQSYMSASSTNSNWPVDNTLIESNVEDALYTITGLTGAKAECNGKKCRIKINSDTGAPVAVYVKIEDSESVLVDEDNRMIEYGSEDVFYLTIEDVSELSSLQEIRLN